MSHLLGLETFQKFAVVGGGGGWSKGILELRFGPNLGLRTWSLDQAEQKWLTHLTMGVILEYYALQLTFKPFYFKLNINVEQAEAIWFMVIFLFLISTWI